jgi:hypothetical protein
VRYAVADYPLLAIHNFVKHQDPHYKERASEIPPPPGAKNLVVGTGISKDLEGKCLPATASNVGFVVPRIT